MKMRVTIEIKPMDKYFDEKTVAKQVEEVLRANLPSLRAKVVNGA